MNTPADQTGQVQAIQVAPYAEYWNVILIVPGTEASDEQQLIDVARQFGLQNLAEFLRDNQHLQPTRLIQSRTPEEVRNLEDRARRGTTSPKYSLTTFWRISDNNDQGVSSLLRELKQLPGNEFIVYRETLVSAPSPTMPGNEFLSQQGYLDAAPTGIDAKWAWTTPGGTGDKVDVVDLEIGWEFDHEDLPVVPLVFGNNDLSAESKFGAHGTYVLGVLAALADNCKGIVGAAFDSQPVRAISHFKTGEPEGTYFHVAEAILESLFYLTEGDVLLLEVQRPTGLGSPAPAVAPTEIDLADFTAIQNATLLGITVIEAAGNGGQDLADWQDEDGVARLDCTDPDHDSGAIMVGAALDQVVEAEGGHERVYSSNFGCRVDCHAWGARVVTTGAGTLGGIVPIDKQYTQLFSETSAASAIIAGAAAITQSWCKENKGSPLTPAELRSVFSDPDFGTPQANVNGEPIGPMPDLRKILGWKLTWLRIWWALAKRFGFIGVALGYKLYPGQRLKRGIAEKRD